LLRATFWGWPVVIDAALAYPAISHTVVKDLSRPKIGLCVVTATQLPSSFVRWLMLSKNSMLPSKLAFAKYSGGGVRPSPGTNIPEEMQSALLARVDVTPGRCWQWTGSTSRGYPEDRYVRHASLTGGKRGHRNAAFGVADCEQLSIIDRGQELRLSYSSLKRGGPSLKRVFLLEFLSAIDRGPRVGGRIKECDAGLFDYDDVRAPLDEA
jgi:hypothetical protein